MSKHSVFHQGKVSNFFEGKRVLIAGASGMTGHVLFDLMERFCAKVTGTCLNNNEYYEDGKPIFVEVDFCDKSATSEFFANNGFDFVFICCAKTYNAFMAKDYSESMILPNIEMTSNILENCRRFGVKKVLFISSAIVYQPSFKMLSEEDLDMNKEPSEIYLGLGWCKRYLEKLCKFYHSHGLTTLVVRPTNIYGRYDKVDNKHCHVIPALVMRALRREDPFTVYGNGMSIKDFINVEDFVVDLARIMAFHDDCSPINVCSGEMVSIREAVNIILKEVGYSPEIKFTSENHDVIPFRCLDNTKFKSLFGKSDYRKFAEGIKGTIEWYSLLPQIARKSITV